MWHLGTACVRARVLLLLHSATTVLHDARLLFDGAAAVLELVRWAAVPIGTARHG